MRLTCYISQNALLVSPRCSMTRIHSCKIRAHANKLLGPRSISVAFSWRLSGIDIPKEKAEVVSESMGAFVGIFLARYPRDLPQNHPSSISAKFFFVYGKGLGLRYSVNPT